MCLRPLSRKDPDSNVLYPQHDGINQYSLENFQSKFDIYLLIINLVNILGPNEEVRWWSLSCLINTLYIFKEKTLI